jgi:flagellar hook protein FlgE
MSLFSALQTSVSGMAAQANALSAISDNIANSSTTGYKEANAQFETLIGEQATSTYQSGGVQTDIRYGVSDQGTLNSTTSATDLAISGNGFFVVSQNGVGQYLTRAGSFVPDSSGNLVNAAGYNLMGYAIASDGTESPNLSVVNVSNDTLQAAASTSGTLAANLPSTATVVTPLTSTTTGGVTTTSGTATPADNVADSTYTDKTSMTVYDNLGNADVLDVYATKIGTDTWQIAAYQQSAAASGGGFPYTSGPLAVSDITFGSTGAVASTENMLAATPSDTISTTKSILSVPVPDGNTVSIDMSGMTQLATSFGVNTATADGNAPSKLASVSIAADGTVTDVYASGFQIPTFKIPLAVVNSPDNLTAISGNVYQASETSGAAILSTANTSGVGKIEQDELEGSTVDLATELTTMITAQRGYEANSKVLQAASDLLSTLTHLQLS